jgi:cell wall-associated NlpC family hydrolase
MPWLVLAAILMLAAGVLAAWKWMPRNGQPATETMIAAAQRLSTSTSPSATPIPAAPANPKTQRQRLIVSAFSLKGIPYRYGAKGPAQLDCSGFTKVAYGKIGVTLPDGSFNQAQGERELSSAAELTPGDLILYRWAKGKGVKHVTMYAGDGWVIGTGTPGQPPEVTVYPLSADLVNDGRVLTYRHIVLPDED